MELFERYVLVMKRGNGNILDCPVDMYEAHKAELMAEAESNKAKEVEREQKEFLKAQGLIK